VAHAHGNANKAWLARIMVGEIGGTCEMGRMGSDWNDDLARKERSGLLHQGAGGTDNGS
jgi:hypothetical protein